MSSYRDDFYRQPELYDLEYAALDEDLSFYAALARSAGRVLELGAGTGRVTEAMLSAGAFVHAVDLSPQMLERLGQRVLSLGASDRVERIQSSFLELPELDLVPLVVLPFNTIHHVYSWRDVLRLFDQVKARLLPGGRFALDMLVPNPAFFERDRDGVHELRHFPDPAGGRLKTWENGWYDPITQINHVRYHYERADGRRQVVQVPMRMWYPAEILGLVEQAGWKMLRCDGDFRGKPLGPGDHKIVLVLKAPDEDTGSPAGSPAGSPKGPSAG
ncbi:MAG: class I SAM-dependent methyltransferase [Myxococcota bacterium]|nr:class I SAM-dependent methyltransferase [Myxococcota bacterium]